MSTRAQFRREFEAFWSAPVRGSSAALFRIAYGLLATWTAVGVLLNLRRFYGEDGMLPWSAVQQFWEQSYSVLALAPRSDALLLAVGLSFLTAAIAMTLGVCSRVSALVIFCVNVALQHRNPYVVNSGDRLFLILAALGACLPLDQRWSLSSRWRRRRDHSSAPSSIWSQRLIQLQIAYVYLFSCFAKLRHPGWRNGEAVYDVLKSPVFSEWPTRVEFAPLVRLLTWSTLAFEFLFPFLVWDKRLRPYVLATGIGFHLGIDITLTIPMFSAIMMVSYACFLTDDEAEQAIAWLKQRLFPGRSAAS